MSGPSRRAFLRTTGTAAAGIPLLGWRPGDPPSIAGRGMQEWVSQRPAPAGRRFRSEAVERTIVEVKERLADPELAWLFENCFPNTLDTTVTHGTRNGAPDTFVITGDIEAMWLRDSTAQVWPYLPLTPEDEDLRRLIEGVIRRQTWCVHVDPYANAFNDGPGESPWADDLTEMKPELHERKWEIDSLCYPIRLADAYWRTTGDTAPFDEEWAGAMRLVLRTFREQQRKDGRGPYKFQRVTGWQTDTVAGSGYGNPIRPVGLIVSIFRPSDDATIFPFLVPSNHFAVTSLRQLAEMWSALGREAAFAEECRALADEVETALAEHAVVEHPVRGDVWAYEVDGFGNRHHMDDANIPSLLSMPYLGACAKDDPLYRRTRAFVLSEDNPYFFRGSAGAGVGGPHAGMDRIWHLGLVMQALTSTDDDEIEAVLRTIKGSHAGTGFMHESFHKDDPDDFTRSWFAWANTLFGELVLTLLEERPHLVAA